MTYALLDSGNGEKLEQFGDYRLIRPAPQALWNPQFLPLWQEADGTFKRTASWKGVPKCWTLQYESLHLKLVPTDFGHLGFFPEHALHWKWLGERLKKGAHVLNLFAYSGATTAYLAKKGCSVCHLDAAKGAVDWARENGRLNRLDQAPIRWIVDDVFKFLRRESKRGRQYDALILDPPSFGRGSQGQVFKIERDLLSLLDLCRKVLVQKPLFVLLTCHTPGLTPQVLRQVCSQMFPTLSIDSGEMLLPSKGFDLPSGSYARGVYD